MLSEIRPQETVTFSRVIRAGVSLAGALLVFSTTGYTDGHQKQGKMGHGCKDGCGAHFAELAMAVPGVTADQKAKIQEILAKDSEATGPHTGRGGKGEGRAAHHEAMLKALEGKSIDRTALDAHQKEAVEHFSQRMKHKIDMQIAIAEVLTAEQRASLVQAMREHHQERQGGPGGGKGDGSGGGKGMGGGKKEGMHGKGMQEHHGDKGAYECQQDGDD